jgi:DnaD/phage-associated family protein
MKPFAGFTDGKTRLTQIPEAFFSELLPQIDDLNELKLALYFFWRLEIIEGAFRYLRPADIAQDTLFMQGLDAGPGEAAGALEEALQRCVQRGVLLEASLQAGSASESLYFANSPKGRAAIQAIQAGRWRMTGNPQAPVELGAEPPNIYRLYEENIGALTPMLAEALKEAEDSYPAAWIEEALRIAVEKNKRNWRYVNAILERWQREGRDVRKEKHQDRRDSPEDRRRYVEGEYSDFIEH